MTDHSPSVDAPAESDGDAERQRVWLVERTYSDDEQNIVILVYATPDGSQYLRKERALTSFDDARDTTAGLLARESSLGTVTDSDERRRYAQEAKRTREQYAPDDVV
ncbi:hypothetical protein [Halobellus sp. Atlit-38R]|uniref:hypothetical protein n=1 Tax=Halobellus sp. Atlit-38R TaxID=2282131 RepID=UPI001F43594C|nr:hypothetical protein [Halobellus sp. Atlit-38R]